MAKLSQYKQASESTSLAKIDGQPFTIVAVEESNYENNGDVTPGVKITTKESFDVDGAQINKFHTTRSVIVTQLSNEEFREALASGESFDPVVCKKAVGKNYYTLEETL